ncbi:hypothetical protein [Eilatimonas milleporae]|uniref:Uncharacterized protein n=1 Tax=Eilatimonas milleporae TaxID=911205 RepID=A0A3M0CI40_9PROT|nr:hypothetical protein [Eilatimonas milleporae]RMB08992.1 hypothetical protein BXY39_1639 [Eilatimonas milleporae]
MVQVINNEGLRRVAHVVLTQNHPANWEEARRLLAARLGAYGADPSAMEDGIAAYFTARRPLS